MATELPPRERVLEALDELAALASEDDLDEDDAKTLGAAVDLLARRAARTKRHLEARAALRLVETLEEIYQRVLDEAAGHSPAFPAQSTFDAVSDAVRAWATATGNVFNEALTQLRLEDLDLDANAIRQKGSVRDTAGNAKTAAIERVEFVLDVPQRTTYDRLKKGKQTALPLRDDEHELAAGREAAIGRIATALEATSGVGGRAARMTAEELYEEARASRLKGLR